MLCSDGEHEWKAEPEAAAEHSGDGVTHLLTNRFNYSTIQILDLFPVAVTPVPAAVSTYIKFMIKNLQSEFEY